MDNAFSGVPLEFITVRTPKLEERYMGLIGTFATLQDACCRKNALPGFYQPSLIVEASLLDNKLVLTLAGVTTDEELLFYLDTAIRNVGGFPAPHESTASLVVEVKSR
ncbi:MAG: hypothetical protein ABRQ26_07340 [Syntrophomonadaceae bacterium]